MLAVEMTSQQQNLLDDLRAPIKSFRIFALEEVIKSGGSPEILSVLEEINLEETDPECSMLISHAIAAVKERLSGAVETAPVATNDSASFLANWTAADDSGRMHILSNLPARLPKDLRTIGPQLLAGSSHVVAARVIRGFCRNWPDDSFNLIYDNLHSESLVLKLAALRTLVHMKPELLLNDLPALLVSTDPQIKALAIRGLVKIDKEEALNHLQALLLSPVMADRLAGIQNCPFLPFDMVKPLMLKYIAAETNAELLTKAGWIIEMNPDVEVPFSLFEIAERSPAKKADLVKRILNESVKLLDKSGILGDQFAAYTKKLQLWVGKRNALRYTKQIVARLGGETVAPDLDKNILVALKQPLVVEAFKEAQNWPVSDQIKARIASYLERIGVKAEVSKEVAQKVETEKPVVAVAPKGDSDSILELVATMTPAAATKMMSKFQLLLASKKTASEVKIAVYNCLTRCRVSGAEDIAQRFISNPDVALATAAVEYLGIVDPDRIFPFIGQCLKVSDIGMKSAALGILKNFDYNQAISSLKAMLNSTDSTQQKMALECMNQFDFALVRDMLTDYLCLSIPEELLEAGLLHFAANPAAENAYCLYKIEQAQTGKIAEQAKKLREACPSPTEEEVVASANAEDKPAVVDEQAEKRKKEEELKERLRLEKEKKQSRRPAYSLQAIEEQKVTSKQQLEEIAEILKKFIASKAMPISIVVLVIVIAGFYFLFVPKGSEDEAGKGGAVVAVESIVEGQVVKTNDESITVKTTKGEILVMQPSQDGYKTPRLGALVRIAILPFRRSSEGELAVKINGMRLIEKYSKEYGGAK